MRTTPRSLAAAAVLSAISLPLHLVAQGQGIKLQNGIDSYIEIAHGAALEPMSGLTVEAWITYDESTLGPGWRFPCIIRQLPLEPSQRSAFSLYVAAGQTNRRELLFSVYANHGAVVMWPFAPGALTTWTHVAGTYDGSTVVLFVNGRPVASTPLTGDIQGSGKVARLGNGVIKEEHPGYQGWNGEIDEVRLWPVARSAAAIQSTLRMSLRGLPGEVASWNLDGNATDSSCQNHGTVVGNLLWVGNNLTLAAMPPPGADGFGTPTTPCSGPVASGILSLPRLGNAAYGVYAIRGPRNASGILWLADGRRDTALRFAGIDIWIDPMGLGVLFPVTSSSVGGSAVTLPVPPHQTLDGLRLHSQFFWEDRSCSAQLWAASEGLSVTLAR